MIQPVFLRAQAILRQSHIPDRAVQTQITTPLSGHNLDTCILEAAQQHACGTIVVGRGTFSWLREFVEPHVADKLIQAEHGEAIWVIPASNAPR
jgi:K+-sensing histidine kinase KdpD